MIRQATSSSLKKEILISIARDSISKVQLFQNCPGLVLNKIRASLVSEIYLPGDIVIRAGTTGITSTYDTYPTYKETF